MQTSLTSRLSGDLGTFVRLVNVVKRLVYCSQSSSLRGGQSVKQGALDAELNMLKIVAAIDEISEGVVQLRELDPTVVFDGSADLQQHRSRLSSLLEDVKVVNTQVRLSGACVLTEGKPYARGPSATADFAAECQILYGYSVERSALLAALAGWEDRCVQFRHLLSPVRAMIQAMSVPDLESGSLEIPSTTWTESDDLIQSMLVVTQGIKASPVEQKDDEATHVPSHFASLNSTANSLRVTGVLDKLDSFVGSLASHSASISPSILSRVLPFVQDLAESFSHIVYARSYSLKSTYKLAYVVARLVLDLAQKGFCKPQEESDGKDDNAGGETVDGTGMGSGTGDKNVSSEIEEESQVEGLQGEKEEDGPEEDKEKEDDAVSMDEDFEGDLGDAKEKDDDGEGSEGDDDEERDDHVGDVDPLDPGAVDERFWGDEEKEEQKDDGKEDLMNEKDEGGESEMAAKESEGEKKEKDEKKKDEQKDGEQQEGEQNEAEEGQQDLDDFDKDDTMDDDNDNEGDERDEGGVQDQDDVVAPEGDRLDLPEDMDLGGDDDDDDGPGEEIDDLSMKGDDEGEEVEPSDAGQASDDDGAQEDDAPAPTGAAEEEANEADDTLNPNVDTSAANDNQAQQSAEAGAGLDGGDDQQGQDKADVEMAENEDTAEGEG
jgi:midasin